MAVPLAVIFDMDGVLIDSYDAHYESWRRLAAEQGAPYTREQFARSFGRTSREILAEQWPVPMAAAEIPAADRRKEELYRRIIRADYPGMAGAVELVRALHGAGFALAIGSSGPRANIEVVLEQTGAGGLFGAVVSGEDVHRGKPDPEIFQIAAARLGVAPDRCAVIEDAPLGVEAARRAGMTPIALTGTATREQLAGAALVVDRLDELSPERIAECLRGGGAPATDRPIV
ncbi:MAG: HAD family phosphatase [Planctomycetes bacterium]|nr:HAD family phosphatase [Planctomycetota bacterium]